MIAPVIRHFHKIDKEVPLAPAALEDDADELQIS